ncbi:ERVV2 protein, partial [Arenaria interpres]|nr:ERVV2 protein [Arenaria interpres]
LASQGVVCTVINTSCFMYIDQSGRVATDIKGIRGHMQILHGVTQDDTSWGFSEIWERLTSWLLNLAWLKQLFVTIIMLVILFLTLCLMIKCAFKCCLKMGDSYSKWKRHRLRQKLESNKYFRDL